MIPSVPLKLKPFFLLGYSIKNNTISTFLSLLLYFFLVKAQYPNLILVYLRLVELSKWAFHH